MNWQPPGFQPPGWQPPGWQPGEGEGGSEQPVLPISKPQFRSIDAKSIADVYNRGTPDIADYKFPNGRRFYQP